MAVAATYAYFLLFAQFAFLKNLTVVAGGQIGVIRPIMAVMGFAGIVGSCLAASSFAVKRPSEVLVTGFVLNALAAGFVLIGQPLGCYYWVALLVGLGVGLTTVTLASYLNRVVGGKRLGLIIGGGTGLAYAFCNLPGIFDASPTEQSGWALGIAGLGLVAVSGLKPLGLREVSQPISFDYSRLGVALWVFIFFTLVGLDSAAFYIIQQTPLLKLETWSGVWRLEINAAMHFGAALLAGYALDRRWLGRAAVVAAAFLLGANILLKEGLSLMGAPVFLYIVGVSIYSVALVGYPARSQRSELAALIYAVAGWGGSALGIGFAENMHNIPFGLIALAGAILASGLGARYLIKKQLAVVLLVGLVWFAGLGLAPKIIAQESQLMVQGRQVFISEGCIHCHSQYVRPGTVDEGRWGPLSLLDSVLAQQPPLLGNRRQGPDLQNIGNRRTVEWNRQHLISPRLLTPGSRMPSYRYLFLPGRLEGEALLAYLNTCGGDTIPARVTARKAWQPAGGKNLFVPNQARQNFLQWCASCHGNLASGNGPAAVVFNRSPSNLILRDWHYIVAARGSQAELHALAQVIKFGVPGTAMAGREYLSDDVVLSLAIYLQTLPTKQ